MEFSEIQFRAAQREFHELATDLLGSDYDTFTDHVNQFLEFLREDFVMQSVSADLGDHAEVDIEKFLRDFNESGGSMVGSNSYSLPSGVVARRVW